MEPIDLYTYICNSQSTLSIWCAKVGIGITTLALIRLSVGMMPRSTGGMRLQNAIARHQVHTFPLDGDTTYDCNRSFGQLARIFSPNYSFEPIQSG